MKIRRKVIIKERKRDRMTKKMNKKNCKNLLVLVFIFLVFVQVFSFVSAGPSEEKNVLILHSYHKEYKWTEQENQGIMDVLRDYRAEKNIYIEYMDTKKINKKGYTESLPALYQKKYADIDFELVISTDDNAFDFLKENHKEIFPNAEFVVTGCNWMKKEDLEEYPNITGVSEIADIEKGIESIKKIHPEIEKIVIIADTTTTGIKVREETNKLREKHGSLIEIKGNSSMEELLDYLGSLENNTAVLISVYFKDKKGKYFEYDRQASLITNASKVPVYSLWSFSLENGVVGGYLTDGELLGREAAKLGVEILEGKKASEIEPVIKTQARYIYDYKTMKKFGINESMLPDNSKIINSPEPNKEKGSFEELSIKLRAMRTSEQINDYLYDNPEMSIKQLQEDEYFKKIAIRNIDYKGYTLVMDSNTGKIYFHPQKRLVNTYANGLKKELPEFWEIINRTLGEECTDSSGYYQWREEDGEKTKKYMYISCVDRETSDGKKLFVAATAYIENNTSAKKYSELYDVVNKDGSKIHLKWSVILIGFGGILVYIFLIFSFKKGENKKQFYKYISIILSSSILLVSYVFSLITASEMLSLISERIVYASSLVFIFLSMLLLINLSGEEIKKIIKITLSIIVSVLSLLTVFTPFILREKEFLQGGEIITKYGILYNLMTFLMLGFIFVSIFFIIKRYSKKKKVVSILIIILITLILGNVFYYIILDKSTPYLLLLSPIFLNMVIGYLLFDEGFLEYKKQNIFILTLSVLLVIIILFMFSTYQATKDLERITTEKTSNQIKAVAESRANHIRTYIHENEERLQLFTTRKDLKEELYVYNTDNNRSHLKKIKDILIETKEQIEEFERVCVIGLNGTILVSTNKSFIGKDISEKEFFKKGKKEEKIYLINESGRSKLIVSAPFVLEGELIGVGIIVLNTDYLNGITTEYTGLGYSGETYLIDSSNNLLTPSRFIDNAVFNKKVNTLNAKNCWIHEWGMEEEIKKNHNEVEIMEDYRNVSVIGTHKYLSETNWCLLVEIDKKEATKSLENSISNIWLSTLGGIILIVLMGILLNILITRSLKEQVESKTEELKEKVSELQNTKKAVLNMMEDLSQANEDLKKLDKAKSEFLNIISHELKTPLTAIIAHLEVLQDSKKKLTKDELKSLEAMRRNSNNLKMLIGNLLEIARMESGKFELVKDKINLNQIIKEVLKEVEILAKQKNIKIKQKLGKLPKIYADEQRMREVITNLVSNAIKFTEKGEIKILSKKRREKILVSVSDTGAGIPEDKIKNLFEKFYQVQPSLSRKQGGTGLGLSITKKIIEAHKGKIRVKSKENKGTKFTFWIPLKGEREENKEKEKKGDFDPFAKYDSEIKEVIKEKEKT